MLPHHPLPPLLPRRAAVALARLTKPSARISWQAGLATIAIQIVAVVLFAGLFQALAWWLGR